MWAGLPVAAAVIGWNQFGVKCVCCGQILPSGGQRIMTATLPRCDVPYIGGSESQLLVTLFIFKAYLYAQCHIISMQIYFLSEITEITEPEKFLGSFLEGTRARSNPRPPLSLFPIFIKELKHY